MSNVVEATFFPFKNTSMRMHVGLCFLFFLQYAVVWLPVISVLNIVFVGYIYATLFKVIFTTGNGYKDAPEFPDFGDFFDSILFPLLKTGGIWLIGFAPFFLLARESSNSSEALSLALLGLGFTYVPIGLMIAAMDDFSKAFNPLIFFEAIRAAGGSYLVLVLTFAGFTIGAGYLEDAFAGSWILSSLLGAYGILFTGRLIGGVYRDRLAGDISDAVC